MVPLFPSPSGVSHFSIGNSSSINYISFKFPSPSGVSHFSILSLTPRILSGLAGCFAWEKQIEAIFPSQTASKSLQTQYLSHARENTPYRRFSPQFTNIFYNNRISACTDAF